MHENRAGFLCIVSCLFRCLFRASRREREYESWIFFFFQNRQRKSCYYYFFKSCVLLQVARETLLYGGSDLSLNLQLTLILYYIDFPQVLSGNFFWHLGAKWVR